MAAPSFTQGVIRAEKLAVFTSSKEIDEWQIREFFHEKWEILSQNMDGQTMLFITGVHGSLDGKLLEDADSLETLITQFTEIGRMKSIREDMAKRKIKAEFLGVQDFYKDEASKEIDDIKLVNKIKEIDPHMVIMVICYSQFLDLKFLLEESGILSEARLNRDLRVQSKGHFLTLSKLLS